MTVHLGARGTTSTSPSTSSPTSSSEPTRSDRPGALRFLPLAATGYVVAALVGNGLAGGETGVQDLAGTPAYTAGIVLEALGLVALMLLVTWAGTRLDPWWSRLTTVAGTTTLAVKLASGASLSAAVHDDLDAGVAEALVAVNDWAFVVHWLPFGVFVLAIALGARQAGLLRAFGAWTGSVLGTLMAVQALVVMGTPAAMVPVPFLLSLFWLAVVGVVVTRRG